MANNVKLASPWTAYYRKIQALFGEDPDIKVVFDEENCSLHLLVDNAEKADALTQLLPTEVTFGNVVMTISVIPANIEKAPSKASLIKTALQGNPAFSFATSAEGVFSSPIHYIVFANKVVQYYNDDLGDIYGNRSTLYQDIAKEIFGETDGIHFCTDAPAAE